MFSQQFLKRLREKEQRQIEYATNSKLEPDDYAQQIGYIAAMREAQAIFEQTMKAYFNTDD
jgi:hypothetical protein